MNLTGTDHPEQLVGPCMTANWFALQRAQAMLAQVQQMLAGGQEVIIGAVTDPVFGKLVAFGLGGVLVEVLKDITFRLAPATEDDALSMLDGIAAAQILKGVRGADPVNRAALARIAG
jgi:acyl-CoA synthetase (NDP forming)